MLTHKDCLTIMKETGALVDGHFELSPEVHSDVYVQTSRVLQYPHYADMICGALAWKLRYLKVDVVVGLLTGSVMAAHDVARALGVRAVFAEKVDGEMVLRPVFDIQPGEKVLIIEDLITTGKSVKLVIDLINKMGSEVVGVGTIIDLTDGKLDFGVPTEAIVSLSGDIHAKEDCPLCKQGIPFEKPSLFPIQGKNEKSE